MTTRSGLSWSLWFVFLATPGSRFLRFDGIPFSSKIEFSAVALSTIALCSSEIRNRVRNLLASHSGNSKRWVTLVFVSAILLKLFTYTLLPLGNGFEACYRSIYAPLQNDLECEKSYEAPFLTNDGINTLGDITRMEPAINFGKTIDYELVGASATTWKLPFANDYPRLSALWLDRLPFTAKFGARIDAEEDSVIPIQFAGEISIYVGERNFTAISYEHSALILIPIPMGLSELRIHYKFADLDSPLIPDEPPSIRGPWAQLTVGHLLPGDSSPPHLKLNVLGWAVSQTNRESPIRVEIRNSSGDVLSSEPTVARPDVADFFQDKRYEKSGFHISLADTETASSRDYFTVFAIYPNGRNEFLGRIESAAQDQAPIDMQTRLSRVHLFAPDTDFHAWYSVESNDLGLLVPESYLSPNVVYKIMFELIDLLVLMTLVGIVALSLIDLRGRVLRLTALVLWFVFCRWIVYRLNLSIFESQTLVIAVLVAIGICLSLRRAKSLDLIGPIAGTAFVAIDPILRFLREFGGLGSASWWGFPLWRGRPNDWFVFQGYARQIFVEESLRGGESLFYFQPAIRYFVFIQHVLFGENDVMLAILLIVGILVAGIFVGQEVLKISSRNLMFFVVAIFICACFAMFSQFDFINFAVNTASEYPTWISMFVVFGFMLRGAISPNMATALTVIAGFIAQFRPNQVFGACLIFVLIQLELTPCRGIDQLMTRLRLILVFVAVLSLSLFHNLHYAATFTLFSTTGTLNSDFQLTSLFEIFNDRNVREIVFDKIQLALYWTTSPASWEIAISFWLFQILWLLAIVRAIGTKCMQIKVWVALILPLSYLVPMLPYRFDSYYPRHIVAIQLAFGLSALYVYCSCAHTPWSFRSKLSTATFSSAASG